MSLRFPEFNERQVVRSDIKLTLQQGRDRRLLVEVRDQDGDLVDISGATDIQYEIAKAPKETPLVHYSLTDDNIAITNDSSFRVDIDSADLSDLSGIYYHDAKVTTPDGKRYSTLLGPIWIQGTVVGIE